MNGPGRRLARAIQGGEPSAGSKTRSTRSIPDLLPAWYAFRDARARRRAANG